MSSTRIMILALPLSFAGILPILGLSSQPAKAQGEDKKTVTEPIAGEEREFEITAGVKMKFCWIPAGNATLGSPKQEKERAINEPEHDFKTKGFWLGKYTVTQAEWKAVMGDNPSSFQPEGLMKEALLNDKIKDTSRFPVDTVHWDDCEKFLEKVNKRDGVEKVFGKPGKFVLPHEDQWEYACRGGKGNNQPFYWGNELNGTQANCNGTLPYGTKTKGQYLERTCAVDDTNNGKYEKHPWGLCHMIGNVMQVCENNYENSKKRVYRGSSYLMIGKSSRSALRSNGPGVPYFSSFRVCLRLD
jgi:formylglycine-generating enzyme